MRENLCDCNVIHQDIVTAVLKNKPKEENFDNLSNLFKILGDKTRIKILWLLDQNEMCVCDIANALDMTKSSISHQLATLREYGVVKFKKIGKEVYYKLDDSHITALYELGLEHIKHKEMSNNEN